MDEIENKKLKKRVISTFFGLTTLAQLDEKPTSEVLLYVKDKLLLSKNLYVGMAPEKPDVHLPPFDEDDVKHCEEKVRGLLENKTVREKICASLKSGGKDIFEVVNTLSPVFITLSATGVIGIPISPLVVAVAVVLIVKIGIDSFCANVQ